MCKYGSFVMSYLLFEFGYSIIMFPFVVNDVLFRWFILESLHLLFL